MMKKKVVVLMGGLGGSGEELVSSLNHYSTEEYELRLYSDIAVSIREGKVNIFFVSDGTNLADPDVVYLRGKSAEPLRHVAALYRQHHKKIVINADSLMFAAKTKLEQYVVLALADVPVPDSVFLASEKHYALVPELLHTSFPLVAKAIDGKNGEDNTLVHNLASLAQLSFVDPVFQPFIPNDFDYRVIVAGGEVIFAYKRIRQPSSRDHMNNITRGGRGEVVQLDREKEQLALRAAEAVGKELCGIDILTNKETGQNTILEVNFNFGKPVFTATGTDKADYYHRLAQYFKNLSAQPPSD